MQQRTLVKTGSAIPRNPGFTIVELLVVIGIIGLLISLLMPSVQSAREAGRRMSCQNNIRQLGLAIQNYESSKQSLPPSGLVAQAGIAGDYFNPAYHFNGRTGPMQSWIVLVLPYLEEANLKKLIDQNRSILQQPGDPQATILPTLLCPSDPANRSIFQHATYTKGKPFAKGNYAAYVSPVHVEFQANEPGALVANRKHRSGRFPDGAGKTMFLAEVRTRDNSLDQRGAWALPWPGSSLLAFDMHSDTSYSVDYVGKRDIGMATKIYHVNIFSRGQTQPPNNAGPNMDMLYDCPDPAEAQLSGMPCAKYSEDAGNPNHFQSAAPRSMHPGGVFITFGDASVHYLLDEVNEDLMAYLISINDSQTLDMTGGVR